MKDKTISGLENRRARRPAQFLILATCVLLLAACGGNSVLEAPEYDFTAGASAGSLNQAPKGRALIITDDNAYIKSVDAKAVLIGQRYWDATEPMPTGLGATPASPQSEGYYTNPNFDYDSAVLAPGKHWISVGLVNARYSDGQFEVGQTDGAHELVVHLAADATYMAASVVRDSNFHVIVVQADCPAAEAMSKYTRGKCYDKGMIVASSESVYIGLHKNETGLSRAEMEAVKAARQSISPTTAR